MIYYDGKLEKKRLEVEEKSLAPGGIQTHPHDYDA